MRRSSSGAKYNKVRDPPALAVTYPLPKHGAGGHVTGPRRLEAASILGGCARCTAHAGALRLTIQTTLRAKACAERPNAPESSHPLTLPSEVRVVLYNVSCPYRSRRNHIRSLTRVTYRKANRSRGLDGGSFGPA